MKLTNSMRRCLTLLDRHGEAIRVYNARRDWSWRIDGDPMTQQVDRCIRAGLAHLSNQNRVVLSGLGQRVLGKA